MTAPGWYAAEGDPPGTQRYWDGEVWIGHPVYEPAPAPAAIPPAPGRPLPPQAPAGYAYGPTPSMSTLPGAVKVLAIILSILKAIPLAFLTIALLWILAASNAVDEELDDFNFEGLLDFAAAVLGGIVVIGLLLLLFQFIGAVRDRPLMVFIPAAIMSLLDGGFAVLAWIGFADAQASDFDNNGSLTSVVLISAVAGAQIYVAVNALRANSK